jgi:hypothetical protein
MLTVQAGEHLRRQAPVSASVTALSEGRGLRVVDGATGASIPAQQTAGPGDAATLTFIVDRLEAREERVFTVEEGEAPDAVLLEDTGELVNVRVCGRPFTTYLYGAEHYRPHFYPVYGPHGKEVTETGAADHRHHRSLYVAYGEVSGVDLWSEGANAGKVRLRALKAARSGPVYGEIVAESAWQSKDGRAVMTDETTWRIYNLPEARRVIEATIVFRATEGDVHFGDTKEGGILSVRVAPSVRVANTGRIENSYGGVNESETWGKRAQWCDYSGYVDGVHLGIAVLDHPSSPRHPCHWHVRNYGLMTTNIFGRGTFERGLPLLDGDGRYVLPSGSALTFRYQCVVHAGDAHNGDIAGAYQNFAHPPKVRVE